MKSQNPLMKYFYLINEFQIYDILSSMEQASVLYMNNMSPSRMSIHPKNFPPAAGTHMYPPVFRFSKIHL